MLFVTYMSKVGIASHSSPVTIPNNIPLIDFSIKCNLTLFFSANQNTKVKSTIARSGIISAHNLQIAGSLESGTGSTPAKTAQPMKKHMNLAVEIAIFFKSNFLQNLIFPDIQSTVLLSVLGLRLQLGCQSLTSKLASQFCIQFPTLQNQPKALVDKFPRR